MNPTNTTTLRQRREGRTAPVRPISRTRLETTTEEVEAPKSSSSMMKSLFVFLIILFLAFLAYFGLKTYLTDEPEETTVTPTTDIQEGFVVSSEAKTDDFVAPVTDKSYWNTESKQVKATSEDAMFEIKSIMVQPYESYIGFNFEISGASTNEFPTVTAEMNKDLNIKFANTSILNSVISEEEMVSIQSVVLNSFKRNTKVLLEENFVIDLNTEEPFALYSKTLSGKKFIVLEILLPVVESTITPTPNTSIMPSAVLPNGSQGLTNEFGKTDQTITSSVNTNIVKITKYNYEDSSDKFTYNLVLSEGVPNVTAKLDGASLIVTVSNLALDGVVGNGGSGSTDLAATGVTNLSMVEITNSNNISTYTFTLDEARDFRVFIDEVENLLTLEVRN